MGKNFSFSLTKSALGTSGSVQSTKNFKFGMTSTTLVIHYEELETDYRVLLNSQYKLDADVAEPLLFGENGQPGEPELFRQEYGDYFVACYQYGGMYEATVSITTNTMEQVEAIKMELGAQLQGLASADASGAASYSSSIQETLRKNNANIEVEIRTTGAGKVLPEIAIVENSRDISAMMLKTIAPYIPVSPAHAAKIKKMNQQLVNLRSYYNIINGAKNSISQTVYDNCKAKFEAIINQIGTLLNDFYDEKYAADMDKTLEMTASTISEFRKICDRYTFYRMLIDAQKREQDYQKQQDLSLKPFGPGASIGYLSFNVSDTVA